jgi:hypothetical protein
MPTPSRVHEVARLAPRHVTVALVEQAAHAVNFSHPEELAHVIEAWLDGELGTDGSRLPVGVRMLHTPRDPV